MQFFTRCILATAAVAIGMIVVDGMRNEESATSPIAQRPIRFRRYGTAKRGYYRLASISRLINRYVDLPIRQNRISGWI